MTYATVDELEARWRPLSESERERAAVLLDDAAAILDAEMERCGLTAEGRSDKLRYVSCQMVRRVMASGTDAGDYSSVSRTAGSFTEQFSLSNPSGDMYLTSNERRLLGVQLRRGRAAYASLCR